MLHAHLPFVRHPEHERSFEERWLYEALTETYLPLLDVLDGLERDRVPARFTVSLSPTLLAMLADPLLRRRYRRHLDDLILLAEREVQRTRGQPAAGCAALYRERLQHLRERYRARWDEDPIAAFGGFAQRGRIELLTTAATHAVLPLLGATPELVRAQVAVGVAEHRRCFGAAPAGFWLPECAFAPGLDAELARHGVRWCILDTHGVLHATPQPVYGVYAPIACPSGLAAFGRDPESATQVWSAEAGYPADPWYRDFHRDIGFERPLAALAPFAEPGRPTGLKYHRITGAGDKALYEPARAAERVAAHAAHFVAARAADVARLTGVMNRPPILVCPYDAELFGHWWFEGPEWLDAILRALAASSTLEALTPSDDLARHAVLQRAMPAASTWGWRGYYEIWIAPENDWIYPRLDRAARALLGAIRAAPAADDWRRRTLVQALRDLLLAESSDWPFMIARGTTVAYATQRIEEHLDACERLCEAVARGKPDDMALAAAASRTPLFPSLDLSVLD